MHILDEQFKIAIEMDDLLEERRERCTQLTKQETRKFSRRPNSEDSELGPSSSKILPQLKPSLTGSTSTSKPHQTKNSELHSKKSSSCGNSKTEKLPTDPCGRCGCQRKYHNPPPFDDYAKTGSSSGNAHKVIIKARTCCYNCKFCFCFCVGFIEPFEGQPFQRCVYEA